MFGLSVNAEIIYNADFSNGILYTMLMTQSSSGDSGGAVNKDETVKNSVNDIMSKLQKPYEEDKTLDEIDQNCGHDAKDPRVYFTNVVIKQEIQ